jgi:hypothetical protein
MAGKIQAKCALCGKTFVGREVEEEGQKVTIIKEIIDGSHYVFDREECVVMFKKFGLVYGSYFYADLCEMPSS